MSLSINNKTIKSIVKDGKEIVKVERVTDGKILYEKENNYTEEDPELILTSSTTIIQKNDTVTITALLKDGQVPLSNKVLNYEIKKGSATISAGTETTDNNGRATINYVGTGIGDVSITVSYGSSLQETYEIEDYIIYDNATTDKTSNYQYNNLNSHTFSTDKYIAQRTTGSSPASTYYSPIYPSDTLPTNYEVSVDILTPIKETDKQFGLCISDEYTQTYTSANQCFLYANINRTALGYRVNGSLTNYGESSSYNANTWYTFKITVNGTSVSSQILNGDAVVQSWNGRLFNIQSWKKIMIITGGEANNIYWKNLQIKALPYESEDLLFYDDASTDKSSKYNGYLCEGGTNSSISYTNSQYTITGGSKTTARLIDSIGQLENCEITFKAKPVSASFSGAIGVAFGTGTGNVVGLMGYTNDSLRKVRYSNSSWQESYSSYFTNVVTRDDDGWITFNLIKQGTTITGSCGRNDFTFTLPFNQCYIGIMNGTGTTYFKEFTIKAL